MKRTLIWFGCRSVLFAIGAAWGLGFISSPRATAQAPIPVGGEFQVNTYTTGGQHDGSVAAEASGDFVVVWESIGSSGTDSIGYSIQGQRYASNGSAQGAQFQVNTYTTSDQSGPSVAADADGDFVVVWHSAGSSGTDTSAYSIQGQRFASNGSAQGAQFQVNTYTTGYQDASAVATDSDGDFVVVWMSAGSSGTDTSAYSIQGRRYASDGSAQGAQFQVNSYTTGYQDGPSVAADADRDFVVVWTSPGSPGTDTSGYGIQGQRYASSGSAQGAQFQVNTYTTSGQYEGSVAVDSGGGFVVVWTSAGSSGTDTNGWSIQGQRYLSNGSASAGQFQINTYTTGFQSDTSVSSEADGDFVVVWQSDGSSGTDTSSHSILGQRYASDGSAQGAQFQVNSYTTGFQEYPSVASDADGDFVVAWQSDGSSGTDTGSYSIQGQRYGVAAPAPAVPAMSRATRFALAAALLLFGAAYALRRRA
ncbi:MAG TPA: hypothetical protein VII72_03470 [Myxococcota bacterium]|jgi:hypothetical protein